MYSRSSQSFGKERLKIKKQCDSGSKPITRKRDQANNTESTLYESKGRLGDYAQEMLGETLLVEVGLELGLK